MEQCRTHERSQIMEQCPNKKSSKKYQTTNKNSHEMAKSQIHPHDQGGEKEHKGKPIFTQAAFSCANLSRRQGGRILFAARNTVFYYQTHRRKRDRFLCVLRACTAPAISANPSALCWTFWVPKNTQITAMTAVENQHFFSDLGYQKTPQIIATVCQPRQGRQTAATTIASEKNARPRGEIRVGLVLLGAVAYRGGTVPAVLGATGAHDTLVHRGLYAVVLLDVQLRQGVVVEHRCLADVTEGRGVHDVPARTRVIKDGEREGR